MTVKIKDIPIHDRPVERLINNGSETLSNEELIAILLKTGTKNISSKELATMILKEIGEINKLNEINYQKLTKIKGIGINKAAILLASLELGKRINTKIPTINNTKITNASLVYEYYKTKLSEKKQEYFCCLYLDNNKKVLADKTLFIGTINRSLVHPREIFKEAYLLSSSAIICVHNHPTGNILPSNDDINLTARLKEAGELLGIKIIDHIIIGNNNYYSFLENGNI